MDRTEWVTTPQTFNAFHDPQMNDINFPAGVLQPPLFDARLDDAPNYGNTGGTIGHELTHGNLKDWWTKKDAAEFEKRTACLTDQYGQYIVVVDVHINAKLTLGEDLADFGGLVPALIAWKAEGPTIRRPHPWTGSRRSSASSSATRNGPAPTSDPSSRGCWPRPIRIRPTSTGSTAWWRTSRSSSRRSHAGRASRWPRCIVAMYGEPPGGRGTAVPPRGGAALLRAAERCGHR